MKDKKHYHSVKLRGLVLQIDCLQNVRHGCVKNFALMPKGKTESLMTCSGHQFEKGAA